MSAKDLLRYLTSVDGLPSPPDIVNANERTDMLHSPSQDNPSDKALSSGYARGWIIGGWGACNSGWNIVQGHNGGVSGGFSNMFFLQEGEFSFVVIGNQDPTSAGTCMPSADPGKSNPAPVPCGRTSPSAATRDGAGHRSDPPRELAKLQPVLTDRRRARPSTPRVEPFR